MSKRPVPQAQRTTSRTGGKSIGSEYTDEEREFQQAIENYKRENKRPFPSWSEVLEVVLALGYRLTDADSEGSRIMELEHAESLRKAFGWVPVGEVAKLAVDVRIAMKHSHSGPGTAMEDATRRRMLAVRQRLERAGVVV